jgi:hypothetical protein
MKVIPLPSTGNSSKFHVVTKSGEFDMAFSFTLRKKVWELADSEAELIAAQDLAEAIVSRHTPATEYKKLYIFAEHNIPPTLSDALKQIRRYGFAV